MAKDGSLVFAVAGKEEAFKIVEPYCQSNTQRPGTYQVADNCLILLYFVVVPSMGRQVRSISCDPSSAFC